MNDKLNQLLAQLSSVIFGKEWEQLLTVCALPAGGDLLIWCILDRGCAV